MVEPEEIQADPAPTVPLMVHAAWTDARGRVETLATIGAFRDGDAAIDAVLAALTERYGPKEIRRKARAKQLVVRVKPLPARELSNLADIARAHSTKGETEQ